MSYFFTAKQDFKSTTTTTTRFQEPYRHTNIPTTKQVNNKKFQEKINHKKTSTFAVSCSMLYIVSATALFPASSPFDATMAPWELSSMVPTYRIKKSSHHTKWKNKKGKWQAKRLWNGTNMQEQHDYDRFTHTWPTTSSTPVNVDMVFVVWLKCLLCCDAAKREVMFEHMRSQEECLQLNLEI